LQLVPEQQLWNPKLVDLAIFAKLPKQTEVPEKFKLLAKRRFTLVENTRADSCIPANPLS